MRGSAKGNEPPELRAWKAEQRRSGIEPAYDDLQQPQRGATHESLFAEQTGQCVYCGRGMSLDRHQHYHIEHFRPRSKYFALQLDYTNLFLSCGPEGDHGTRNPEHLRTPQGRLVRGRLPYPTRPGSLRGTLSVPLIAPHRR